MNALFPALEIKTLHRKQEVQFPSSVGKNDNYLYLHFQCLLRLSDRYFMSLEGTSSLPGFLTGHSGVLLSCQGTGGRGPPGAQSAGHTLRVGGP